MFFGRIALWLLNMTVTNTSHPLYYLLAKFRAFGKWYAAFANPNLVTQQNRIRCSDIAEPTSRYWTQRLEDHIKESGVVDKRLHGYALFGHYAWLMTTAALACYLLDRRVPGLNPTTLWFSHVKQDSNEVAAVEAPDPITQLQFARPQFYCLPNDPAIQHEQVKSCEMKPNCATIS